MKQFVYALLLFPVLAFGFGPSQPSYPAPYIGAVEFSPWLDQFIRDGKAEGTTGLKTKDLRVQWSELPGYSANVIGLCERGCDQCPRVSLRKSWWDRQTDSQKKLLMHHELGHCLLNRGHRQDLLSSGVQASIMYPSILPDRTFVPRKAYYLSELFEYSSTGVTSIQVFACPEDGYDL